MIKDTRCTNCGRRLTWDGIVHPKAVRMDGEMIQCTCGKISSTWADSVDPAHCVTGQGESLVNRPHKRQGRRDMEGTSTIDPRVQLSGNPKQEAYLLMKDRQEALKAKLSSLVTVNNDNTSDGKALRHIVSLLESGVDSVRECYAIAENLTMDSQSVRQFLAALVADRQDRKLQESINRFCNLYAIERILKQQGLSSRNVDDSRKVLIAHVYGVLGDWTPSALDVKYTFKASELSIGPKSVTESMLKEKTADNALIHYVVHLSTSDKASDIGTAERLLKYVEALRKQQSINRQVSAYRKSAYRKA